MVVRPPRTRATADSHGRHVSHNRRSAGPAYATFTVRARALVIDTAVLALGLIVVMLLSSENLPGSGGMTVIAFFALLIFYEPILVAVYGATLGHRWSNLRVIRQSTGRPPNVFVAFGRYLLPFISSRTFSPWCSSVAVVSRPAAVASSTARSRRSFSAPF